MVDVKKIAKIFENGHRSNSVAPLVRNMDGYVLSVYPAVRYDIDNLV